MSATPSPISEHYYHHGAARLRHGASRETIEHELVAQGLEPALAEQVVRELIAAYRVRVQRRRQEGHPGREDMIIGGVICGVGIAITVATYQVASSSGGGTYLMAWGPIIFGGWRFLRGAMRPT